MMAPPDRIWDREPPTICFVTERYPPEVGGVAAAARRIVHYLIESGCIVHVVSSVDTRGATRQVEHTEEDGAAVHRLHHDFSILNADTAFVARDLVSSLDEIVHFDLFHGFFLTAAYSCIGPARAGGRPRPVIASIRGSDAAILIDHPYCRPLILQSLKKATWITSVNQTCLDRVSEDVDISGRCSVIANGIEAHATSRSWRLDENNRGVVGTVGDFRRVKDIPLLVRGYAGVSAGARRRLLLVGFFSDKEEEDWSNTLIDEFGIRSEVRVTGRVSAAEVQAHFHAMHVYVQSSAFEGMPNALLEAAAVGTPIVATAVGGIKEIVVDGTHGLLVPHGEPAQLSAAIQRILTDPLATQRLSAGARDLAGRFSTAREKQAWLDLYRTLLSTPAGGSPSQSSAASPEGSQSGFTR